MQQIQDLYVINVEGIENVGKTTLLNHIKKKITDNNISNIDASHKFPTSDCGVIMTQAIETIDLFKKDITKYLDKLKDCNYKSARQSYATILYELLMGVSYQYEKLAEANIKDQYNMIYNSSTGKKFNLDDNIIINDRGVLSAFYLNYCEKYYYEALATNIYASITETITNDPFYKSFIEEPFDSSIIDISKKKSEDWVVRYIDDIYYKFRAFVINTMTMKSDFIKDYNDFKVHYHNLTLLLMPNDEFVNSSGQTEESIKYKAFFDSDKEQIQRSYKFLNALLSIKRLQENDPIPGISYIENIDIYIPNGTRKSSNRILQDLCCSKILEENRPDVQLLLSQLLEEEI